MGAAVAAGLAPLLRAVLPSDFPRLHEIGFSFSAAAFAVLSALVASAIAGLIPALRQLSADPRAGLAEENRVTSGVHRITSLRGAMVAAEVALSCVLCFGAVLLVRSAHLLEARDHGFDAAGVLTFRISLPQAAYPDQKNSRAFYQAIVDRWLAIPGVKAAALTTNVPWTGYDENTGFDIPGRPSRPGESIQARFQSADPGMLSALHMRLLQGRWIEPADHADAPPVIVVNETMARRYFDGNAVGRIADMWEAKRRIVGVVADLRDRPADAAAEPAFWFPLTQIPFPNVTAALRTTGDPGSLLPAAKAAIHSLDPELPISDVRTMETITAEALAERRFALWLCEAFALLAMGLAAIGVYGLLTYVVEQRRREIGIRLALGASRAGVVWAVLSNGLALAGAGIIAGLALAPLAGRAISSLLFGVTAADPSTLAAAPSLILLIALLGALAPGWIASRTEPMSALREQ
jgi:predicted permease